MLSSFLHRPLMICIPAYLVAVPVSFLKDHIERHQDIGESLFNIRTITPRCIRYIDTFDK